MATTTNGIYYPSDYDAVADIPEDMRKMAESIDEKVINDVKKIKTEQTQQNTELKELKAENERLKEDLNGLPKGTAEGENICLIDSADMRFSSFEVSGNSKQEGEPTPDTPIEVKSCGDNITNIFNKNTGIITGQYIGSDGSISTDTNLFYQDFYIKVEALKQYTISSNITTIYRIAEYDVNKTFIQRYLNGREQTSWTFTVSNNCKYIKIAGTSIQCLDSLKLEKGSTPTPYTPYGQGSINEIICNKNLAKECNGVWYDTNSYKYLSNSTVFGFVAKVEPNKTYTINKKNQGNRFIVVAGAEPVVAGNSLSRIIFASNHSMTNHTFTTQENEKYVFLGVHTGTDTSEIALAIENVQIEEGAVTTEYEEHKEQVYTIPTQQPMKNGDTFLKVNGKWHERHKVGRLTLNGTENWQKINGYGIFYINDINNLKPNTSDNVLTGYMSTHFKEIITNDINAKKEGFCVATINRLYFFHNGYSTDENLEGFKTWLQEQYNAGTPVCVEYELSIPNDIECTEEQTTILKEIENISKSYKEVTHIYSTDEIGPNIKVTYFKDIETMINKQNTRTLEEGGA